MNQSSQDKGTKQGNKDDGLLEKIAKKIDPAGMEVTDEEIMDPGANIRDFPSRENKRENENKTDRNPSGQK